MTRLFLSVLLLFGLAACRPPEPGSSAFSRLPEGVSAGISLAGPAATGPAEVTVTLTGTGVDGATVTVTGDMTHAGMVPVISETEETEPGVYRTADFRFTMGGDWMLLADVTLKDGSRFEVLEPVSVSSN